ncbi:MAG: STN domain-containing protein [Pirellulales bacterium]|nr:STN domain-containing protein [Pirellulales bacterium]
MSITRPVLWGCLILILRGNLAEASPTVWLTGRALHRRLAEPVDLFWSENPLQSALHNLAQTHRVAVFLDPRVDPGRKVQLSLQNVPLREALRRIASAENLEMTLLGPVVYYGPPRATPVLRTLAALRTEEVRSGSPARRKKFLASASLTWDDFAEPRDVIQRLAEKNGLTVEGLDNLPHDLWAAADLPPLTLVERLTLLLTPFGRTCKISPDGRRLTLVTIPENLPVQQTAGAGALDGGDAPAAEVALADKRFTLTVQEKPFIPLMRQLVRQIGLELQMDDEALRRAGVPPDRRVSFRVREATIDQLLQAALGNLPLRYRLRGKTVVIEPLPPGTSQDK